MAEIGPWERALPAPTTSILGRAEESTYVTNLLWDPEIRLVSLLGPGGVGKTRLAVEVAWELQRGMGFDDGVHLIDLAAVDDPDLVAGTVARALGIVDMGTGHDLDRVLDTIADLDLLLVLDNFEHLLPAVGLVATLLAGAPRLSILVTSRVPLHLRGEHEVEIGPLAPDDAVALFLARARAVNPRFRTDAPTEALVSAICAELDRLPLAIELAASRTKVLSAAELHARMRRRLEILTSGPTDQPPRLQSMRATISWSHDALTTGARHLLRSLSVFAGGWTLVAAEAVRATGSASVVDELAALVDHHLVQRSETSGDSRFSMFETVREFAADELTRADDAPTTRANHAAFFTALAHAAEEGFTQADQTAWLDRVEVEHDNFRAALQWALDEHPSTAIDLAGTLWRFWLLRGYVTEGLEWLERGLSAAGNDTPSAVTARALLGAGSMLEAVGDDDAAGRRYLAALGVSETLGDRLGIARACRHIGNAAIGRGQYAAAIDWYTRSRDLGVELGDTELIGGAVSNLGSVAYFQGDLVHAERCWSETATIFRDRHDSNRLATALNNLAELATLRGEPHVAVTRHQEVLELRRELRDPIGVAQTSVNLGRAILETGDAPLARTILAAALTQLRNLGIQRDAGACLYNLALVARAQGELFEAARLLGESLAIKHSTGERFDTAQCLELTAALCADRQLLAQAAHLLGAATSIRSELGARPAADDPDAIAIFAGVSASGGAFSTTLVAGQGWSFERAVGEATDLLRALSTRGAGPVAGEAARASSPLTPAARRVGLTAREFEVLGYLAQRYTDREIAAALTISLRTVTTHVARILTKLGVEGRRQAATEAARLGLLAA